MLRVRITTRMARVRCMVSFLEGPVRASMQSIMAVGNRQGDGVRGFNGGLRRRASPVLDVEYLQVLTAWCVKRGTYQMWDLISNIVKHVTSKSSPKAHRNMTVESRY